MAEVLLGTGVVLLLGEEFPEWPHEDDELRAELEAEIEAELTVEERADRAAHERGEIIFVCWHVFAEVEDDGRRFRIGGSYGGEHPVRLDEDPTSALLAVAEWARDSGNMGCLLGDLRIGEADVTRFEFHAAPHKIELSAHLRRALRGTWKEREPGDRFVIRNDAPNFPITARRLPEDPIETREAAAESREAATQAGSLAEGLLRTGVTLLLEEELPRAAPAPTDVHRVLREHRFERPELRAQRAALERGEIMFVSWHLFADLEREGTLSRFGGYWGEGVDPIELDRDPTSGLLEVAGQARDGGNLGNLLGDLRMAEIDITRFEFYAAPLKVELSEKLRTQLRGTWRYREPAEAVEE